MYITTNNKSIINMQHYFYVKESQLHMVKDFIRTLPTARFLQNPEKIGNHYSINLDISVDDNAQLDNYLEYLREFDIENLNPPYNDNHDYLNLWDKVKNKFKRLFKYEN